MNLSTTPNYIDETPENIDIWKNVKYRRIKKKLWIWGRGECKSSKSVSRNKNNEAKIASNAIVQQSSSQQIKEISYGLWSESNGTANSRMLMAMITDGGYRVFLEIITGRRLYGRRN